jgi:cytochrome c biogenesis protein CcdA
MAISGFFEICRVTWVWLFSVIMAINFWITVFFYSAFCSKNLNWLHKYGRYGYIFVVAMDIYVGLGANTGF